MLRLYHRLIVVAGDCDSGLRYAFDRVVDFFDYHCCGIKVLDQKCTIRNWLELMAVLVEVIFLYVDEFPVSWFDRFNPFSEAVV